MFAALALGGTESAGARGDFLGELAGRGLRPPLSVISDGAAQERVCPDAGRTGSCDDHGMVRTVLIVDDHAEFRAATRALLEAGGFTVAAEAADGRSALQAAATFRPDLVLLDIQLPDVDGFTIAETLAGQTVIVLISSRRASSYRGRLAASSVAGFLTKSELTLPALTALLAPR
jgi:CheY-like chemotaxis protein